MRVACRTVYCEGAEDADELPEFAVLSVTPALYVTLEATQAALEAACQVVRIDRVTRLVGKPLYLRFFDHAYLFGEDLFDELPGHQVAELNKLRELLDQLLWSPVPDWFSLPDEVIELDDLALVAASRWLRGDKFNSALSWRGKHTWAGPIETRDLELAQVRKWLRERSV